MRFVLKLVAMLAAVVLGLAILVQAVAYVTWALSPAGDVSLEALDAIPAPDRNPVDAKAVHTVSEWPADRPRRFQEAPALAARVRAGDLRPVEERVGTEPLVITPPEQCGPYGGTWARLATSPSDVGVYPARIAYEHLVRWGPMGRRLLPNVAARWEVADGGRTYTFHLRRGMRWSDGAPFGAHDILFWYKHVIQNKELTPVAPRDLLRGGRLVEVEAVGDDDACVRFRFAEPHGMFLQRVASEGWAEAMLRAPAHYLKRFHPDFVPQEQLEAEARRHQFDFWYQLFGDKNDWRNEEAPRLWAWVVRIPPPALPVVFERNPYYWKVDAEGRQLPYIDRMTFEILDAEVINQKAIAGEMGMQGRHIQFENYPLFMEKRRAGASPYRVLHWIDSLGGRTAIGLNLNHKDPVLRGLIEQPDFRKALSLAIDRNEINEVCYFGVGVPRQMAPPPSSLYRVAEYEKAYVEHDPAEANRLLDGIGLTKRDRDGYRLRPDGQVLALWIEVTFWNNSRELELVAEYWRGVGVKAEVRNIARQLFYERKRALLHDCAVWGGADEQVPILDPRWFLPYSPESIHAIGYAMWFTSNGRQGEEPRGDLRRVIDLYREIEQTPDEAGQIRLFREIADLNRRNLWVIGTIGQVPAPYLVQERFRNVPEVAIVGWMFRTPGNTAPECYAIEEN